MQGAVSSADFCFIGKMRSVFISWERLEGFPWQTDPKGKETWNNVIC